MLGIAIDGGNGYSGKPRPCEDYFKNKGLADASAGLETGDETVEVNHAEVMASADAVRPKFAVLVCGIIRGIVEGTA